MFFIRHFHAIIDYFIIHFQHHPSSATSSMIIIIRPPCHMPFHLFTRCAPFKRPRPSCYKAKRETLSKCAPKRGDRVCSQPLFKQHRRVAAYSALCCQQLFFSAIQEAGWHAMMVILPCAQQKECCRAPAMPCPYDECQKEVWLLLLFVLRA